MFLKRKIFCTNQLIVLLMLFCANLTFSQKQSDDNDIYKNAAENLYAHPEKTITVSEYLSINAASDEERSKALNLKAEAQILQGNYIVALNALLESLHLNSENDDSSAVLRTNLILSELYRKLGIIPKAEEKLNLIEEKIQNNPTENPDKTSFYIDFITAKSALLCEQKKYDEAIKVIDERLLERYSHQFPYQISKAYNQLAKTYGITKQWDESAKYAGKSLQFSLESGLGENYLAYAELERAKANFGKKHRQQYLSEVPQLLVLSEKVNDVVLKKNIHQFLADFYLSEGDNSKYQFHNLKYLELNDSITSAQQKASDLILSLTENDLKTKDNQRYKTNYILIWIIGFAIVILGVVFWLRIKAKQNYNNYKDYISKLKKTQAEKEKTIPDTESVEETSKTPQFIPQKTEQVILEKLIAFENGNDFTKKSLTLQSMAKELDTNTRYLSEIVNKHKQKNFNSYINELRVNYIINKLRNEPAFLNYKISYLAEESGFTSHTSFSTVFKTVTGIPPKEFINFIKKELSSTH
ncbi:helix-turn-helix domain-containing protein [Epilithonimonas zeae]|uniref:helix-turn-helix domain-containing protein n=1 Tax=Epilithonimonas zeae TaxID=1416779 RepID=UPI00200C368C|nr:helix-turn-helix domain-containing protein [Epilithonimonas zeae]UQB69685.1 helix-turn-helix domain-containing protein [Epilithonimonas zeae]